MTHMRRVTVEQIQQTIGPVDRVAARCSRAGETFAPTFASQPNTTTWDAPPLPEGLTPPNRPDYSGIRRGSLVAFRYWKSSDSHGSMWVCRCDCGKYEARRIAKWVKKLGIPDMCVICQKTFYITHGVTPQDTRSDLQRKQERKAAGCEQ